jgi:hypothetical protein
LKNTAIDLKKTAESKFVRPRPKRQNVDPNDFSNFVEFPWSRSPADLPGLKWLRAMINVRRKRRVTERRIQQQVCAFGDTIGGFLRQSPGNRTDP